MFWLFHKEDVHLQIVKTVTLEVKLRLISQENIRLRRLGYFQSPICAHFNNRQCLIVEMAEHAFWTFLEQIFLVYRFSDWAYLIVSYETNISLRQKC